VLPPSGVADHEHSRDQISAAAMRRILPLATSQADTPDGDAVIYQRWK
jgi:hypothetical protein